MFTLNRDATFVTDVGKGASRLYKILIKGAVWR
jgi:hypothetical protein